MDWKVVNALSRDVEREQLNKILKDIRSTVDNVSSTTGYSTAIQDAVGKMVINDTQQGITVSYNFPKKVLDFSVSPFNINLIGNVTGSGLVKNNSDVTITTKIDTSLLGVPEAPVDNMAYVRLNAAWSPLALQPGASVGEIRRRVSIGR